MKLYSIRWLPKPGESVEVWTVEAATRRAARIDACVALPPRITPIHVVEIEKRVPKVWRFGE